MSWREEGKGDRTSRDVRGIMKGIEFLSLMVFLVKMLLNPLRELNFRGEQSREVKALSE